MNREKLLRAAKLSFLSEEDAVKAEERVNRFLQYISDLKNTDEVYENEVISDLREDEITEQTNENTGYVTVMEKKHDYED